MDALLDVQDEKQRVLRNPKCSAGVPSHMPSGQLRQVRQAVAAWVTNSEETHRSMTTSVRRAVAAWVAKGEGPWRPTFVARSRVTSHPHRDEVPARN